MKVSKIKERVRVATLLRLVRKLVDIFYKSFLTWFRKTRLMVMG